MVRKKAIRRITAPVRAKINNLVLILKEFLHLTSPSPQTITFSKIFKKSRVDSFFGKETNKSQALKNGFENIYRYNIRLMQRIIAKSRTFLAILTVFGVLISCAPTMAKFDYVAYENAISLKVETLYLMSKATNPYPEFSEKVEALQLEFDKAYEYARQIPNNEITTRQWEILKNPDNNLLGGFLKRWQEEATLSSYFIEEAKIQVSGAFDNIIGLETKKIKSGFP